MHHTVVTVYLPRTFRSLVFLCPLFLSAIPEKNSAADEVLPVGAHPAALETPHFPDRLHAFVWRNWQLVEPQRMAGLVGTATSNIKQIATSMGLGPLCIRHENAALRSSNFSL